jgi:hypothetical protein
VSAPVPASVAAEVSSATDGKTVDWARFTATVQSAIRRTEH